MLFLRDILFNAGLAVGGFVSFKLLWQLISIVYRFTVYSTDWKAKWGAGASKWAVVTGATDGIGREYAVQLAKKGYSVLIVGRSVDKLKEVSQEILATGSKVEELVLDFSKVKKKKKEKEKILPALS